MAVILNLETSGSSCSAALTDDGLILAHREDFSGRNHSAVLSDFIKDCLDYGKECGLQPQAVAVSMGPGSYTGLRIGLSEAKGLAYALRIPLIGISTLELLAATAMFECEQTEEDAVYIPMVDARRMEVYTAAYDSTLHPLMSPQALVLAEDSYSELRASGRPIFYFGSGAEKAQPIMADCLEAHYLPDIKALATYMMVLADRAYGAGEFIDTAYSVPIYIKDFMATKPKPIF